MFGTHGKRLFVLFLTFGLLLTVQYRILSKGAKHVGVRNLHETAQAVEKEKAELEQLKASIASYKEQIKIYEEQGNDVQVVNQLESRRKKLMEFLNYTDVEGPGVIVIVDDSNRELSYDETPNSVLVHDQDISKIVEELKNAGAEALSINDTRIVFNQTQIVCVGPTVKVNGEQMSSPYVIKAIGHRKHLEAAINSPDSYAELLVNYGLFVEVNTSISVKINKYDGEMPNEFIEFYEEGD